MVLSRGFRDRLFRCLRITDLDVLDLAQELEAFALLVDGPVPAGRQGATSSGGAATATCACRSPSSQSQGGRNAPTYPWFALWETDTHVSVKWTAYSRPNGNNRLSGRTRR